MKPLIVANWKMNPSSERVAKAMFRRLRRKLTGVSGVEIAVAPPFPYLTIGRGGRPFRLAAQDVFWENAGAYTGEVSPAILADLGVSYVIVGHSERRRILGEDDGMVNRKVRAVLAADMAPIVAVGEERSEAEEVVPNSLSLELAAALHGVPRRLLRRVIVMYEPVWAISGTPGSKPASPDHATRRAIYLRKLLTKLAGRRIADAVRIMYGGSVSAANAANFISRDVRGMDGLVVGVASLDADEFAAIARSVGMRGRASRSKGNSGSSAPTWGRLSARAE
ncbi:MAG: triose-phosphate isomerase [bacterium]|nr:triose-phosphate isomerase [bacterium]